MLHQCINICGLLVMCLLLSTTEAALDNREYPPVALQADACFTSDQKCQLSSAWYEPGDADATPATGYTATFSSQDGRWHYSPKHIFDKNPAGYPGQWLEGTYLCAAANDCPYKYSKTWTGTVATNDVSEDSTYKGEWVRLDVPGSAGTAFTKMTFWAGSTGRPHLYKVLGSSDGGTDWTELHDQSTAEDYTTGSGTVITKTWLNTDDYTSYLLVVSKLAGTSNTLQLLELAFYSAETYCPTNKYVDGTDCTPCDLGKYSTALGATQCAGTCGAGLYMPSQVRGLTHEYHPLFVIETNSSYVHVYMRTACVVTVCLELLGSRKLFQCRLAHIA
jgi:hypothetical protein